jgi:DNA polymerase
MAWFDDLPAQPARTPGSTSARPSAYDTADDDGSASLPAVDTLDWDALAARVAGCERCRLCEKRTNTVFGVGDRHADWMLIGEAPGENEDRQGEPFVGQAGKLLDNMLQSLSLGRSTNVYIANVIKCRPPGNRNPEPDEVARCEPYLQRQVALVQPKLIIALGRFAAQSLLKTDASISSLRGRVHQYEGVPVVVTYHPAYLLRSLHDKAKSWQDLCLARATWRNANGAADAAGTASV